MLWAWLWFFGKSKIEKTVGDDSVALVFETFIIRGTAIYLSNTAPVRNIGKRMAGNLNGFTNDSKPGKIDVVFVAKFLSRGFLAGGEVSPARSLTATGATGLYLDVCAGSHVSIRAPVTRPGRPIG